METVKETLSHLPRTPGVYIYRNAEGVIIYIGKAVDLSRRVKQYFERDDAVGEKTPLLVLEIRSIETIQTASEFDALLLEAKLIHEHQPKYNVIAKDDKSPLYIAISIQEELPRIYFTRKPKIASDNSQLTTRNESLYFGPFQSARVARELLRWLRHIVPYCTQKERNGRNCFYTHLHLCDPCPSYIAKLEQGPVRDALIREYRKHMFRLRDILSAKAVTVISDMEKEMQVYSDQELYEEALAMKSKIETLRGLLRKKYDPSVYVQGETLRTELFQKEREELITALLPYYPGLQNLHRIECYDISNTQGTNAVASMVVATDGQIDKNEYRRFRMKTKQAPNDFAMMAETIKRRFNHPEWEFPDLVVVDGGKGQVRAAQESLSAIAIPIPIIGLAKREEEIVVPIQENSWKILHLPFSSGALKLLERIRDEAHRFAITYHKKLRGRLDNSRTVESVIY
jgi:excinuclease ABC subunit C